MVAKRKCVRVTAWASGPARAGGSCGNCHRRMSRRLRGLRPGQGTWPPMIIRATIVITASCSANNVVTSCLRLQLSCPRPPADCGQIPAAVSEGNGENFLVVHRDSISSSLGVIRRTSHHVKATKNYDSADREFHHDFLRFDCITERCLSWQNLIFRFLQNVSSTKFYVFSCFFNCA